MSEVNHDALTMLRKIAQEPGGVSMSDLLTEVNAARRKRHPMLERCGLGFMMHANPVILGRLLDRLEEHHRISSTLEEEQKRTQGKTRTVLVPHFSCPSKESPMKLTS